LAKANNKASKKQLLFNVILKEIVPAFRAYQQG